MRLHSVGHMLGSWFVLVLFSPLLVFDVTQTLRAGKSIGQAVTEMQEDT